MIHEDLLVSTIKDCVKNDEKRIKECKEIITRCEVRIEYSEKILYFIERSKEGDVNE